MLAPRVVRWRRRDHKRVQDSNGGCTLYAGPRAATCRVSHGFQTCRPTQYPRPLPA